MSLPLIIEDIKKRVLKSGDTLSGDLVINKNISTLNLNIPNSHAAFWINKNTNADADYGTYLVDRSNDEKQTALRLSALSQDAQILKLSDANGTLQYYNILDGSNYTSYVPTLTGTGASGTWPISITGNATTLGGFSESSFLRDYGKVRGIDAGTDNFDTLWSQIGIKQYELSLPDNMEDGATYNYGATISLPSINARFDLWYNHQTSRNGDGLRYRTGWNVDKCGWLTLLDSKNYSKFSPTLTGGGASGTWTINVTGSAGKLATARNIALGGDLAGSANFDGSGNITINAYNYSCSVNSNNTTNYPFHRIATCGPHNGSWVDKEMIIMIRHYYNSGGVGVAKIGLRTNDAANGDVANANMQWLYRFNISEDALQMGFRNTAKNALGDLYYRVSGGWARCEVYQLQGGRSWTLINSTEAADTTTSDKKGSTEVYTSVSDGGNKLGRGYTHVLTAVDGCAHPTTQGTSPMTANSSGLGTNNVYLQYV